MKALFLLIILTNSAWASKTFTAGETVKASQFNSASFNVGAIQHSILTVEQFQSLNGDCWKLLNGQNIAGTDYAVLTNTTLLPDARGLFFRGANNGRTDSYKNSQNTALGGIQNQDWKDFYLINTAYSGPAYTHGWHGNFKQTTPHYSGATFGGGWFGGGTINWYYDTTAEVRPKNITINYFIKVNKACSFL